MMPIEFSGKRKKRKNVQSNTGGGRPNIKTGSKKKKLKKKVT